MNHGTNQELNEESIYYMIARETGLNAKAMHDEKLIVKIRDEVAILEGKKVVIEDNKEKTAYDPSANLQDVEVDEEFQKEQARVEAELQEKQKEALGDAQGETAGDGEKTEEKADEIAEKLAEKLEEKLEKRSRQN